MTILHAVGHALELAFSMTWEITWALILGFTLSAAVQAVVRRESVTRLMGGAGPRSLAISAGIGGASSSCSYAAVALARSLFRKGASFTAAMAFQIASTNLVIELGIILILLMGWEFASAEFIGGPVMIVVLAMLFRLFLRPRMVDAARRQADQGVAGSMEGHAAMDMSVHDGGSLWAGLTSRKGFTAISHIFVMEWAAVIRDIVIGLLIAGAVAAWVPNRFWQGFFLVDHPLLAKLWGPLVGPIVAILSFVCSIGNVPLAAVLWNGGISFGGVVSFIFGRPADHPDPPHLPEVLRGHDGGVPHGHLLRSQRARRLRRRAALRCHRSRPRTTQRPDRHGPRVLELHHVPQHRLPNAWGRIDGPVRPHRRARDVEDDERRTRRHGGASSRHPRSGGPQNGHSSQRKTPEQHDPGRSNS
jgi:uncharacterized membrane protein YraQ (UPF0718 family)